MIAPHEPMPKLDFAALVDDSSVVAPLRAQCQDCSTACTWTGEKWIHDNKSEN